MTGFWTVRGTTMTVTKLWQHGRTVSWMSSDGSTDYLYVGSEQGGIQLSQSLEGDMVPLHATENAMYARRPEDDGDHLIRWGVPGGNVETLGKFAPEAVVAAVHTGEVTYVSLGTAIVRLTE